ncbi:MAG: L,D-transpeptidase/peptidoglycan binding protein [Faecalicatena sp.]|uniref:L,D-transpeptidase family protein n=1 Tax=Faecalicatena sp. TaxID=2005360 RepID=UPI00258813D3|nr:peptidoglycan binding domain-containing protein [Faecalicatena sp.]MCI6465571.1 L,D-transpeptidase/peptidoglycan binding protein [Faecalicatena sp.]MDY5617403.1 peptidoglycan binding domain-containing protein [Lachnospiraceae bacterium]
MAEQKKNTRKIYFIIGSILCLFILSYIGISLFFTKHFLFNTEINSQNFSAKTAAHAEKVLKKQVQEYELTILGKNNQTDIMKGSDISLVYKENDQLKNILKKQNAFSWPLSLFSKKSASISIDLDYNKEALDREINSLKAVTVEQTQPKSAQPKFDKTQFVIEPEVYGTAVDKDRLKERILSSIMKFDSKINLEKEKCYAVPAFTSDSDLVKQACSQMNQYCEASITYPMNGPVVVDKALISKWLKVDDKMNVMFHDDAVRQWLSEFGDQYDTVGTTRTFTTPTGKSTSVSGGTYGWSIDEDTEFEKLKSSIQNKEVVTREPAYYIGGVAASHTMPDWGNTYVDVDLSEQHMWYLKDGAIVLETDVVTGEPIPEKITPEGTFSIQDKKQNEVLVGSINPSTGKPSYETQVSYWMRITWDTGIGLHDATWQSSFGGTRNQIPDVGSHGCINMPIDQAAALYHMIEVGTPVVVHY